MDITTDETLLYFFKKGDKNAFKVLFEKYYPPLHAYGVKISNDPSITEDCLQSFFIYLFEKRKKLDDIKNLKSYFFISFKRALLKNIKECSRISTLDEYELMQRNFVFSVEETNIIQEVDFLCTKTLHHLLNDLAPREREVVYFKYYVGLNTIDISEVMEISGQSVLNTLQKAMIKLRKEAENQMISNILKKY
ncbi:hypothetical protein BFP77_02835 [Maribacter sp. 4U21]|uniref:RNA polymerase sigma factor n=1 Tax=Maribacter sp. 4U21 TaxID=1889779 RepID=UPI000C15FCCF|nr:sigma-70 family RNA polymerase sigma factor [Maribacter sp. 4U21]PIB31007.1 hypothetical protein BFP77_02835 [Maribacter sp. 4U21]